MSTVNRSLPSSRSNVERTAAKAVGRALRIAVGVHRRERLVRPAIHDTLTLLADYRHVLRRPVVLAVGVVVRGRVAVVVLVGTRGEPGEPEGFVALDRGG